MNAEPPPGLRDDRGDLARAAEVAGFLGSPYGEPRYLPDGWPLRYFLKEALYQPALVMSPKAVRFLHLNQQRIVHKSQGLWRDWEGQPVATQLEAIRLARGAGSGTWVTTTLDPARRGGAPA